MRKTIKLFIVRNFSNKFLSLNMCIQGEQLNYFFLYLRDLYIDRSNMVIFFGVFFGLISHVLRSSAFFSHSHTQIELVKA